MSNPLDRGLVLRPTGQGLDAALTTQTNPEQRGAVTQIVLGIPVLPSMGAGRVDDFLKKGDRCRGRLGQAAAKAGTELCQRLLTNFAALLPFVGWKRSARRSPKTTALPRI